MEDSFVLRKHSLPMIVSTSENETDAEFHDRWKKFDALDDNTKNILSSEKIIEIIQKIARKYSLTNEQMADVARMIRSYYFGELKVSAFEKYMITHAKVDTKTGSQIAKLTTKYIINKDVSSFINEPRYNEDEEIKKTQISLSEALTLYPKVENQIISTTSLIISNHKGPAAGTVTNWIYDYRDNIESSKRGSIERGRYLFNSTNTKGLSAHDRQKVSLILKSLDENTNLTIDTTNKKILFPQRQKSAESTKKAVPASRVNTSPSQIHSNAAFALPPKKETNVIKQPKKTTSPEPITNATATPLKKPLQKKTVRQATQPQQKMNIVGTEDGMTFTSTHALPAEKEKNKTPFQMKPIGSGK